MDARRAPWRTWAGPLLTLVALAAVEVMRDAPRVFAEILPAATFLGAMALIVFSAFVGGRWPAFSSALLFTIYTPRLSAQPGEVVRTGPEALVGMGIVLSMGLLLAAVTLWMRAREAKATERAIAAERERARVLGQANESLEAFSYVVSHDLKEPLRAVQVLLEALAEDERDRLSPAGTKLLAEARQAASRLRELVEGLLDFSRAANTELGGLVPVRIADAFDHASCRTRYDDAVRDRHARLEHDGLDLAVRATVPSLAQILGNLVVNAVRHNASTQPRVRITAESRGDNVAIHVDDNGPGYPPHILESLGRPGRTARGGFGLTIVKRATERLGGSLELHNLAAGGARATIVLPAAGPASPAVADPVEVKAPA
ncbi:MAG TPA: HAMP domain-containing sensor histidine kinase [Candidatus Thermoplasmatota archaeon]|nr:HAMP domain-containing sensor histidine kinase [Candidatus Thermoplasmatota archaeon]